MEFLLVTFPVRPPRRRAALVSNRFTRDEFSIPTNIVVELEAGVYWVTLDGPDNFSPPWQKVSLHATAVNGPMEVIFEPL